MRGKHDDDTGGMGPDNLPGQPFQVPDPKPNPDSPAPSGGGEHGKDDKKDKKG